MKLLSVILVALLNIIPGGKAYMKQLQPRDSILIADQIEYGFSLDSLESGVQIGFPDFKSVSNDTLVLVRDWQIDTLVAGKPFKMPKSGKLPRKPLGIRASVILSPFEEGTYGLPDIPVGRRLGSKTDTIVFEGVEIEVKTMPVDTATFVIHDIKGQIRYPLTFKELFPWVAGALVLAGLIALAVCLVRRRAARRDGTSARKDPAYIVALRELDKYRGEKYWAPEKQKAFYSGITDALKIYIDDRFSVDAPEMTTAELFDALKGSQDITPDLYGELKDLFETADFVKFAKHIVSNEDNARALPTAVRFVTSTYQAEIEEETSGEEAASE